jgi:TPR repeat protein
MKRRRYKLEFKEAAENGDPEAQIDLGLAYDFGNGVPQDDKEAVKWWRKAVEQGHTKAQFALGFMYYKGDGVLENYVQAYAWWNIAAANEDEDAK